MEAECSYWYVSPRISYHASLTRSGVAHETEVDDVYNGYFIPKGTRILPLDW
jgi:hypothetical protein